MAPTEFAALRDVDAVRRQVNISVSPPTPLRILLQVLDVEHCSFET